MSKAANALQAIGIFNPFNAAARAAADGGVGVCLDRRPEQRGRASRSAAWQVVRPGSKTDPEAHWQDYGNKTFTIGYRYTDAEALAAARAWAEDRYQITAWAKIPGLPRAEFPAGDAALVKAALKTARKAADLTKRNTP